MSAFHAVCLTLLVTRGRCIFLLKLNWNLKEGQCGFLDTRRFMALLHDRTLVRVGTTSEQHSQFFWKLVGNCPFSFTFATLDPIKELSVV